MCAAFQVTMERLQQRGFNVIRNMNNVCVLCRDVEDP